MTRPAAGRQPVRPLRTSVVVCTYTDDRTPMLREAVAAVVSDDVGPDEVVVVVDHAPALAARLRAELAGVSVVESTGPPGLSGARNTGVEVASGDVVAFLDDDARPRPGWLGALVDAVDEAGVAGAGGRAEPRWELGRPAWFPDELDWVVGCSYRGQATGDVRNPIGAVMAFRRAVLRDLGGFSTDLGRVGTLPVGCEETEVGLRANAAGWRVVLVDTSVVDHFVPAARASVAYVVRRCYGEGVSKAAVRRLAAERGAGGALAPERRYLLTLAAGMGRGLVRAVRQRSAAAAAAAVLIPLALAATAVGFARGWLAAALRRGELQPAPAEVRGGDDGAGVAHEHHHRGDAGGGVEAPGGE